MHSCTRFGTVPCFSFTPCSVRVVLESNVYFWWFAATTRIRRRGISLISVSYPFCIYTPKKQYLKKILPSRLNSSITLLRMACVAADVFLVVQKKTVFGWRQFLTRTAWSVFVIYFQCGISLFMRTFIHFFLIQKLFSKNEGKDWFSKKSLDMLQPWSLVIISWVYRLLCSSFRTLFGCKWCSRTIRISYPHPTDDACTMNSCMDIIN